MYLEPKSVVVQPFLLSWEIVQAVLIQIQFYVSHDFAIT